MTLLGMDTQRAREHGRRLEDLAIALDQRGEALGALVAQLPWSGSDAEAFRADARLLTTGRMEPLADRLRDLALRLAEQAAAQDATSAEDLTAPRVMATAPAPPVDPRALLALLPRLRAPALGSVADGWGAPILPLAPLLPLLPMGPWTSAPVLLPLVAARQPISADGSSGYLHQNDPLLPDALEEPLERFGSAAAGLSADVLMREADFSLTSLATAGDTFGLDTSGVRLLQRQGDHWGSSWRDLANGTRVPTVAEMLAGGTLVGAAGAVAAYNALPGLGPTALADDRPGGIIHRVRTAPGGRAPQDLGDLILQNNALRAPAATGAASGSIGIQEVRPVGGGEPVYIVQIPPTEGADIRSSDAWGPQGNSRDWAANLALVSGQRTAGMDDVLAAMAAPGADGRPLVPAGARVMLVGHSQGGIIAAHLAADPTVNSASGAPGTYDVTCTFSVGSPVQTVVPAQAGTEIINVSHRSRIPLLPTGDPIPTLDLGGLRMDGGGLGSPRIHDVRLDPVRPEADQSWIYANHDSVGPGGDPTRGYAGDLRRAEGTEPTLRALQGRLEGTYLGEGVRVTRESVVDVGRTDRRAP